MHKRITLAVLTLITIVIIVSMAITAKGQSIKIDTTSYDFKSDGTTSIYTFSDSSYWFVYTYPPTFNPDSSFTFVGYQFAMNKANGEIWTLSELSDYVKIIWPKQDFERYVKSFKVADKFKSQVVEVRISLKGWNEDYTFNEFRKLIYEQ